MMAMEVENAYSRKSDTFLFLFQFLYIRMHRKSIYNMRNFPVVQNSRGYRMDR